MNPTKAERKFWNDIAGRGCIACLHDGRYNLSVSIHHIEGRSKKGCHRQVLALCAGHHQDGTGPDKSMIAVHPFKRRFEQKYGSQEELLAETIRLLELTS